MQERVAVPLMFNERSDFDDSNLGSFSRDQSHATLEKVILPSLDHQMYEQARARSVLIDQVDSSDHDSDAEEKPRKRKIKMKKSKLPPLKIKNLNKSPSVKSTSIGELNMNQKRRGRNSQSVHHTDAVAIQNQLISGKINNKKQTLAHELSAKRNSLPLTLLEDQSNLLTLKSREHGGKPTFQPEYIKENTVDEALGTYQSVGPWKKKEKGDNVPLTTKASKKRSILGKKESLSLIEIANS